MPSRDTCGQSLSAPDLDLREAQEKNVSRPRLSLIVSGGLQSNKYSVHFSRFIAESWLCNMLRKRSAKIDNDFWCYCAVAHLRGNIVHRCPFH